MSVQITIVGLGQIGSSIGLALKAHDVDVHRVGHDKDPQAAKEAQKAGAVDDVKYNLPASVRDANIVILALPLAGIRETLEIIAPDLQDGTARSGYGSREGDSCRVGKGAFASGTVLHWSYARHQS